MNPALAGLPPSDWEAPPAPARPAARLYLPGNECLAQAVDHRWRRGRHRAAGRAGRAGRAGDPPSAPPAPPPADRRRPRSPRRDDRRPDGAPPSRRSPAPGHRAARHAGWCRSRVGRRSRPTCSTRGHRSRRRRCPIPSSGADRRPAGAAAHRHDRRTSWPTDGASSPSGRRRSLPTSAGRPTGAADRGGVARRGAGAGDRRPRARRRRADHPADPAGGPAADGDRAARGRGADARAGDDRHRRDELDDQELAHLEEQSELADEVARLDAELPELESSAAAAGAALQAAEASIDEELATLAAGRVELVARLDARASSATSGCGRGSAASPSPASTGTRCGGCHLDLSTSELGDVKAVGSRAARRMPAVRPHARALTGGAASCCCGSSATAVVTVWFVFRDPRFDYRLLVVGSVLPLLDGADRRGRGCCTPWRSASCCWPW